ncbi:hypothetical protein RJ640_004792 [Escallonia rubra]|uniref:Bifunctional inhibitor/plant lipid transfer protein/seed storage helical domain-containing protein n=1 Tax=Escallonia rubra TaxID=112253 RepID=A0AA88RQ46_9ASTE|nr:hypothetical protein RJ640_004792 [Escallonia rubra]
MEANRGDMGKLHCLLQCMVVMVLVAVVRGDKPTIICNVKMTDLATCLPAITGTSPQPPTVGCCKVMHKTNLHCLCSYKDELRNLGVDPKAAMALPKKCVATTISNVKVSRSRYSGLSLGRSISARSCTRPTCTVDAATSQAQLINLGIYPKTGID